MDNNKKWKIYMSNTHTHARARARARATEKKIQIFNIIYDQYIIYLLYLFIYLLVTLQFSFI